MKMRIAMAGLLALAPLAAGTAHAGLVNLANPGVVTNDPSYEFTNPANTGNVVSGAGDVFALGVPGQYSFLRQFTQPDANNLVGTSGAGSYGFQDTYVFEVPTAVTGEVLTATLNFADLFNIANLQVRLYGFAQGSALPGATVGAIPGGAVTPIGWTGFNGGNQIQLNFSALPAGTYYLDLRGTVTGTSGGQYTTLLAVQPVPLPAGLPLLAAGLGLLGLRRRRAT